MRWVDECTKFKQSATDNPSSGRLVYPTEEGKGRIATESKGKKLGSKTQENEGGLRHNPGDEAEKARLGSKETELRRLQQWNGQTK